MPGWFVYSLLELKLTVGLLLTVGLILDMQFEMEDTPVCNGRIWKDSLRALYPQQVVSRSHRIIAHNWPHCRSNSGGGWVEYNSGSDWLPTNSSSQSASSYQLILSMLNLRTKGKKCCLIDISWPCSCHKLQELFRRNRMLENFVVLHQARCRSLPLKYVSSDLLLLLWSLDPLTKIAAGVQSFHFLILI